MDRYIPFHVPTIGEDEIAEVTAVLRSGWLTTGSRARQFEEEFARYTGARYALAVNSCTAALQLALGAMDIGPGDEVITSPLTFCATVNCILHAGARPVLADVNADGNLDPAAVAGRITGRTRAILPVHFGGRACDMDRLWAIAERAGLTVIEDAAHAAGSRYHGQALGAVGASRSEAVAYSFYATKNITTGEGGMVTTNHEPLATRMRVLALHGISKDAWMRYAENGNWFYQVLEPGFKSNLCDVLAAIGIHQLRRIDELAAARRRIAEQYRAAFNDLEELQLPSWKDADENAWHLFPLLLRLEKLSIGRREFIEQIQQRGIGVSVHFIPIPMHPCYSTWALSPSNACPRAQAWYEREVSLPLYPNLDEDSVMRIIDAVKQIVARSVPHPVPAMALTGSGR